MINIFVKVCVLEQTHSKGWEWLGKVGKSMEKVSALLPPHRFGLIQALNSTGSHVALNDDSNCFILHLSTVSSIA